MMKNEKFAVFILTHGRANNVITYNTLRKHGYTGKIYLIIDNEDSQADEYYKLYGEQVIMFDKLKASKRVDTGDNFKERNMVIFARNSCFKIAEELEIDYFLELDDDYNDFSFRKEINDSLVHTRCRQLDKLFDCFIDFLETSNAKSIAFAQGGDFIGGVGSKVWKEQLTRKVMNSFFCKTSRPFDFYGRINEDTTMYTLLGQRGELFFTSARVMLNQMQTQANAGGLTDIYLALGTYVKSFYSVMFCPSCVKVALMGMNHQRIHHRIAWNNCCPKILNEKWKK